MNRQGGTYANRQSIQPGPPGHEENRPADEESHQEEAQASQQNTGSQKDQDPESRVLNAESPKEGDFRVRPLEYLNKGYLDLMEIEDLIEDLNRPPIQVYKDGNWTDYL